MEVVIQGFPNYRLDRMGNVYSCYVPKTSKTSDVWRVIQPVLDKGTGYFLVTLVHDKKRKNQFIHRLLAIHFIPNPLQKAHVNHLDGVKQNNALTNLEWATPKENTQHAIRIGLCDKRLLAQSSAVEQFTLAGELVAEHVSLHEAGRTTGIAWQNISKVVRGIRNHAGGYYWRYK